MMDTGIDREPGLTKIRARVSLCPDVHVTVRPISVGRHDHPS